MKNVSKIVTIVILLFSGFCLGQSTSEKLKKEQKALENKLASTQLLLNKTKSNTEASLSELKILENQLKFREQLLRNYDQQVRSADMAIVQKAAQIEDLRKKLVQLKEQYKKMLIYAYKHRNKYGQLMYVFSSDSYHEAVKRVKYIKKIAEIQQKQFVIIQQNQALINNEIELINSKKQQKLVVLSEKKIENLALVKDKEKQQSIYTQFRSEESRLLAELEEGEKKKKKIKEKINEAIRKEIAEAEERRRIAEAKRRAEAAKNKITVPVEKTEEFVITKELALIDKSFEANRGRLPWPVEKGTITESFGRNAHPTLENVFTNNNGIDISSPKNAEVRAVYEGEVTSVLNIPGAGRVVIVKHGNYRTVYSNLQNTYVSVGSIVKTKQAVGSLLSKNGESISVVHFEIHQVVNGGVQSLNPSSWVSR
ncbi:MAG: septal ring factor EnvC (AmiA/AmiB activator) [Lentimonas sp.]|jgi:septal ring factor EnvC (AmiA/AmiB activator)